MKDQPQQPGLSGSVQGSDPGASPGEKRSRVKPEVPPRRNPPPQDPAGDKSGATSDLVRGKPVCRTGSFPINQDPPVASETGVATSSASVAVSDRVQGCRVSSSPLGTCHAASSPLTLEGDPTKGRSSLQEFGKGVDAPVRPCVTFDPNPTILLTGSDGSPVKFTGKESGKRFATGSENVKGISSGENQGPPTSSLKKGTEDPYAPIETGARMGSQEPEDCHLRELYAQVNDVVSAIPDEMENANEDEAEDPSAVPMIWISKWVDYSDKYGLGYQLSDDSIGVLFNDFTKLLLLPDGENIHYIERGGQEHYHQLSDHPESLYKKVTLLRYFRNYMNEHLLKAGAKMAQREGDELARIPSLKTYFRTRSAIILHLTNGTLQINFFEDHTKVILCPLMGAITYIDKKRNFRTFRLETIKKFGCKSDLGNRIRYARNMIQKLLLTKSGSSSKGGSAVISGTVQTPQLPLQSKQAA